MTPCPDCGNRTKIHKTYVAKGSENFLVVRACSNCRTEWVHATREGKWYRFCHTAAAGKSGAEGRQHSARLDNRAHRLGRLIAVLDVANQLAGLKTRYIERYLQSPKFASYNWRLECETNAISSLEPPEIRKRLDRLIQKQLGDREDMRSDEELSAVELRVVRAECRRYTRELERELNTKRWSIGF